MPFPEAERGTPLDWLRHAKSDLALARAEPPPDVIFETLCYHAQQAAEKSLKGLLLLHGIRFPYTHSLSALIALTREAGIEFPLELEAAAGLTEYAIGSRYPGDAEPVSEAEYRQAIVIAQQVYDWAENIILSGDGTETS